MLAGLRRWLGLAAPPEEEWAGYVPSLPVRRQGSFCVPLVRKLTLEEAEAACGCKWEGFKTAILQGDEIWTFCSRPEDWAAKAGRAGVGLVREGKIVREIITMMN